MITILTITKHNNSKKIGLIVDIFVTKPEMVNKLNYIKRLELE